MTNKAKYGRRNVSKMRAEWNALRNAGRAEGTPAIQAAIDDCEEWIDFAFQPPAALASCKPAQPVAVKVKPLVWEATAYFGDDPVQYRAGGYVIELKSFAGKWKVIHQPYGGSVKNGISGYPNAEAIKAAVQSDYEAGTMALLDVQPITVQDAARVPEIAEGLAALDDLTREMGFMLRHNPNKDGGMYRDAYNRGTAALRAITEGRA